MVSCIAQPSGHGSAAEPHPEGCEMELTLKQISEISNRSSSLASLLQYFSQAAYHRFRPTIGLGVVAAGEDVLHDHLVKILSKSISEARTTITLHY